MPRQNRRRLARLAGLLELADDEFSNLKKQAVARLIRGKLSRQIYGLEVYLESVTEYVRRSAVVGRITQSSESLAFKRLLSWLVLAN